MGQGGEGRGQGQGQGQGQGRRCQVARRIPPAASSQEQECLHTCKIQRHTPTCAQQEGHHGQGHQVWRVSNAEIHVEVGGLQAKQGSQAGQGEGAGQEGQHGWKAMGHS
jgi:hypothetical protein